MKNKTFKKIAAILSTTILAISTLTGCAWQSSDAVASKITLDKVTAEVPTKTETIFKKGVYVNYSAQSTNASRDYFYIFYDEDSGYTQDGKNGIGLPFRCVQQGNSIIFHFGGEDDYGMILNIDSVKDGVINGTFDNDGNELVFEHITNVDPDGFDAMVYVNQHNESVYNDSNGWSVKYDPDYFSIDQTDNLVSFIYTGESTGTNIITAAYITDKNAENYINELAASWGEGSNKARSIFPGTKDVDGYWAYIYPSPTDSGMYMTAVARDYKDGLLIFELTGHNGDDNSINMAINNSLSMIIDSLTFI